MPLKLKLRPREKVIIGGAVLTNGSAPAEFTLENKLPVLRQKDIMTEAEANTHCKRIYFLLQMMYIANRRTPEHYNAYLRLIKDLLSAAPSAIEIVYDLSESVLDGNFYQALKRAQNLIAYETEVINRSLQTRVAS